MLQHEQLNKAYILPQSKIFVLRIFPICESGSLLRWFPEGENPQNILKKCFRTATYST